MTHLVFDTCLRCGAPRVVPVWSLVPVTPRCVRQCVDTNELLEDAVDMVVEQHAEESDTNLGRLLTGYVGSYQLAVLNEDSKAARAFLANTIAVGKLLLGRHGKNR